MEEDQLVSSLPPYFCIQPCLNHIYIYIYIYTCLLLSLLFTAGICAAALYIACRMSGVQRSANEIVYIVKVCEQTLHSRLEEIKMTQAGQMSVTHFQENVDSLDGKCRGNDDDDEQLDMRPPCLVKKVKRQMNNATHIQQVEEDNDPFADMQEDAMDDDPFASMDEAEAENESQLKNSENQVTILHTIKVGCGSVEVDSFESAHFVLDNKEEEEDDDDYTFADDEAQPFGNLIEESPNPLFTLYEKDERIDEEPNIIQTPVDSDEEATHHQQQHQQQKRPRTLFLKDDLRHFNPAPTPPSSAMSSAFNTPRTQSPLSHQIDKDFNDSLNDPALASEMKSLFQESEDLSVLDDDPEIQNATLEAHEVVFKEFVWITEHSAWEANQKSKPQVPLVNARRKRRNKLPKTAIQVQEEGVKQSSKLDYTAMAQILDFDDDF